MWEFPKIRGTLFGGPLKGTIRVILILPGSIRVPLKGSMGVKSSENRGALFGGPYNKDPTI